MPDTSVTKSRLNRSLLTSTISLPSKVSVRGYTNNFKRSSGSIVSSSISGVRTHKRVLDGIAIKLLNRVQVTPKSIEVSKSDCPTVVTVDNAPKSIPLPLAVIGANSKDTIAAGVPVTIKLI